LPIPLGGIAIKKSIPADVQRAINDCIKRSILYAKERLPELSEMVRVHAQEMEESVMRKHIDLYVNHFSEDLNVEGEKAVRLFEETAAKMGNTAKHSIQIEG
jgi:1,4-dihydroxy-6-naphthoate synthase